MLEKLYFLLPASVQNCVVSTKGLQLLKSRKGGNYFHYRREIADRSTWTREQLEGFQLENLRQLVQCASSDVPFYKEAYGRAGLGVDDIEGLDDIRKFPAIDRAYVKEHVNEFLSSRYAGSRTIAVHTTGTTGSPLEVVCDKDARQKNYAYWDEYLASVSVDSDARHVTIGGRIIVSPRCAAPPFWRYSYFQKSLLMSSYHLSEDTIGSYVAKIKEFGPSYIESYPSSVYRIARYMLNRGLTIKCNTVITSSELLFPYQREAIETAFNCQVLDFYGAAEMCIFVAQCKLGSYHVRPDYGILEILDNQGNPVAEGELGEVVCTGFVNKVMPLIRYPIGDRAVKGASCNCGLDTPILGRIEGRQDDVIFTHDLRAIGRLGSVLKGYPVLEAQYIQKEIGKLEVLLLPGNDFQNGTVGEIENALRLRVGSDMDITIKIVNSISRGKGGKLKSVVSYVDYGKHVARE